MRLDPITVSTRLQIAWRDLCPENLHFFILLLSGGHSSLDPRLPIPNRTVKRVCADDSVHCARESRLPPGHTPKPRARKSAGVFLLVAVVLEPSYDARAAREVDPGSKDDPA